MWPVDCNTSQFESGNDLVQAGRCSLGKRCQTVRCKAVRCKAVWCKAVWCKAVRYQVVRCIRL